MIRLGLAVARALLATAFIASAAVSVAGPVAKEAGTPARDVPPKPAVAKPAVPRQATEAPSLRFDPFAPDPEAVVHGDEEAIAWGGHGEIRLADDRVLGTSDPEWFSIGRVNGFARARLATKWRLAGEGTWDRATDDFVLERAELTYRWRRMLQFHGGIFPAPLGRTNLRHDAPLNPLAEHSLLATQLIGVPNAMLGAGLRGATRGAKPISYEIDLVTGLSDGLLFDSPGGTRLPFGRSNYGDNNGLPSLAARVAFHPRPGAEWGLAGQTGIYNETKIGGVTVDGNRWVHLLFTDGVARWWGLDLTAEAGVAFIDIPPGLIGLYAEDQWGASLEASRTLWDPLFGSWRNSALRLAVRGDAVDLDRGLLGDSRHRVMASVNVHHKPYAIARFGWYYELRRDRFNNDTPHAGVTFTAASYF